MIWSDPGGGRQSVHVACNCTGNSDVDVMTSLGHAHYHLMIPEDPDREQTSKADSHCNNSFTIAQLLHA